MSIMWWHHANWLVGNVQPHVVAEFRGLATAKTGVRPIQSARGIVGRTGVTF